MVVLMEYSPGLAMKRKGAEDPGLFACSGDGDLAGGIPLSCRATKIRRLESAAGHHHDGVPAAASVAAGDDVMMAEAEAEAQSPSPVASDEDEERAVVVYNPADAARGRLGHWRLVRPWAALRGAGAEWISDMLREAEYRTVRAVLSRAQEEAADLAVVPWGAAVPAPAAADQASTAAEKADEEEEDARETTAMDVEEEERGHQAYTSGGGCREGHSYRWPQHCMAPPPVPAVGQASQVMWSW